MSTPISRATPPPITITKDLDRSLLEIPPPEGMGLQEATVLVYSIVRSSTLETPLEWYAEESGAAFKRKTLEAALMRKNISEYKELFQVRRNVRTESASQLKGSSSLNRRKSSNLSKKAEFGQRRESRERDERFEL